MVSPSLVEAAESVRLAWNALSDPSIAAYVLRYGTIRGRPNLSIEVKGATTATVWNLAAGKTYFFTVAARNTLKIESPPSNEVSYTTAPLGAHRLTVINGSGSGTYTEGTRVRVTAYPSAAGQRFGGWKRDWQVLSNPFVPSTTALMLFRDLTIEATYTAVRANDRLR